MKKDKLTRQQLNSLDKDIWITLLLDMQDPILQQTIAIEKLTEQIALMKTSLASFLRYETRQKV